MKILVIKIIGSLLLTISFIIIYDIIFYYTYGINNTSMCILFFINGSIISALMNRLIKYKDKFK